MSMAWENIEGRLQRAFSTKIVFPMGTVWLPANELNIDEWLTSAAETEEESKELDIPRFRFLQNRFPNEKLLELEWEDRSIPRYTVWFMQVGTRAYILLSGLECHAVAAIEPNSNPRLYQAVVRNILLSSTFTPAEPTRVKDRHPDLLPEEFIDGVLRERKSGSLAAHSPFEQQKKQRGYFSQLLFGWVGGWFGLPVVGYYHDLPREDKKQAISH